MALQPKGLLFDLDNTLVDRDRALAAWLHGLELSAAVESEALRLDNSGYKPPEAVCDFLAGELGSDAESVWERMGAGITRNITADRALLELLVQLKQSMAIAVVSNGGGARQRNKLKAATLDDVFGERVVISGEVGCEKPSNAIFERGLQAIGCAAADTVFVGDNLETDIAGANSAGLASIWVARGRRTETTMMTAVVDSVTDIREVIAS